MKSKNQGLVQKTSSNWDPCPNHFGTKVFGYAKALKDEYHVRDPSVFENEPPDESSE
jgi:hypothetical protein